MTILTYFTQHNLFMESFSTGLHPSPHSTCCLFDMDAVFYGVEGENVRETLVDLLKTNRNLQSYSDGD